MLLHLTLYSLLFLDTCKWHGIWLTWALGWCTNHCPISSLVEDQMLLVECLPTTTIPIFAAHFNSVVKFKIFFSFIKYNEYKLQKNSIADQHSEWVEPFKIQIPKCWWCLHKYGNKMSSKIHKKFKTMKRFLLYLCHYNYKYYTYHPVSEWVLGI